jgi:hypothetical protein
MKRGFDAAVRLIETPIDDGKVIEGELIEAVVKPQ